MEDTGIDLEGYVVARLTLAEEEELQAHFERCSDYFEMVEGVPTSPSAASEELTQLPPGKEAADRFFLGVRARQGGGLVGSLELVRDYPEPGVWWVALLLLDPDMRGGGLGERILEAVKRRVRAGGGRAIQLIVLHRNPAALRFWKRHGFEERGRKPFRAATGRESTAITLELRLETPAA